MRRAQRLLFRTALLHHLLSRAHKHVFRGSRRYVYLLEALQQRLLRALLRRRLVHRVQRAPASTRLVRVQRVREVRRPTLLAAGSLHRLLHVRRAGRSADALDAVHRGKCGVLDARVHTLQRVLKKALLADRLVDLGGSDGERVLVLNEDGGFV